MILYRFFSSGFGSCDSAFQQSLEQEPWAAANPLFLSADVTRFSGAPTTAHRDKDTHNQRLSSPTRLLLLLMTALWNIKLT